MENKVYNEKTLEYEDVEPNVESNVEPEVEQNNTKAVIIVRGYIIYAKSEDEELYDFFYPALQNRMTLGEAKENLPENHKLLTIERVTRNYEIPMSVIEQYGKIIN